MTNFKKQIVSAAAAGAMLLNLAIPAAAGTTIEISGNGAGSENWTTVNQENKTVVNQNNTANVTNKVNADANTGGNDANFNTGGDVVIGTGDAKVKTDITNVLNSNSAEVECCNAGNTNVNISGNGANSENGVTLNSETTTKVYQDNYARVKNEVDANAKTGNNDANKNVGGDVIIGTGDAKVESNISTTANVNAAKVGSSLGNSNPSASFVISGNGAGSDNYITAALEKLTKVDQDNNARITNKVDADAETGKNDANFNTGGDVIIGTGDATVKADVDNSVNFNYADVDCGCTWDVLAKISGNGAESDSGKKSFWDLFKKKSPDNIINLTLDSKQLVFQDNDARLYNDVEGDAKTGKNDAELNVGEADTDPAIYTGDATSYTGISNSGNVNSVGDFSFDMPEMPEFEFSFSFAAMMAFFGMSI